MRSLLRRATRSKTTRLVSAGLVGLTLGVPAAAASPAQPGFTCEIFTTLPHPAEERAVTYEGEATWQWEDGTRRVSFQTHCTTAQNHARCDDPVATWHDTTN